MRFIRLESCAPNMVVGKNVYGFGGVLLLSSGTLLKDNHIEALDRLGYLGLYIDDEVSKGIEIPEVVNPVTRMKASVAVQDLFSGSKFTSLFNTSAMVRQVEDILRDIVTELLGSKDLSANLTFFKSFDTYTYQHCVDVAILCMLLGKELKLGRAQLNEVGKSAIFHDIGKMFIAKKILLKPGALDEEEYAEIKRHPKMGYDCLKYKLDQTDSVSYGALYHHERFDGNGYPFGIAGKNIPLIGRLIAVADAYDAITSKRVYKDAMPVTEAYEYIMANKGSHYDPEIVDAFMVKIPPFPVGTCVRLSDGQTAIVAENRPGLMMRPLIKLIKEHPLDPELIIDLAYDEDARALTIFEAM